MPTQMEFINYPLQEVCQYLSDFHGIKVQVDEAALNRVKIDRDLPITFNVKNVPFGEALHSLLPHYHLDYTVGKGVLLITTGDVAAKSRPGVVALQQALPNLKLVAVDW